MIECPPLYVTLGHSPLLGTGKTRRQLLGHGNITFLITMRYKLEVTATRLSAYHRQNEYTFVSMGSYLIRRP
ncbi:hypothetical protein Verru16b_02136 [Lacunisphaera limnophila]|uniref:Uncharacterized protein n=1 Tax=Lacunisphaera limnophila TaxID=1838286 RepID=A0A1D8AW35_9BACT|nr:hypothetical protein Verru16b_02136 [Lacunisphaera limnophila]